MAHDDLIPAINLVFFAGETPTPPVQAIRGALAARATYHDTAMICGVSL